VKVLTSLADLGAMREALRELAVASEGKSRRTWAVLGPVAGASREELMDLGRFLVRLDISRLVVVGEAGPVHAGAVLEGSWGEESRHVDDPDAALTLLRADLSDHDVVLVSGVPEVLTVLSGLAGGPT
jgi:UDP-N-acetylmuramoyl-tripeptide--D-alanyl-D-alanine ligase